VACRRQADAPVVGNAGAPVTPRESTFSVMSKQTSTPEFLVDVRELVDHPGAHRRVVLDGCLPGLAIPVARVAADAPVHVDVEVESVVEGLLVTGQVTATATMQCARCLRGFDQEVRARVQELFASDPADTEEGYAVLPDERLALDTMVRDAVVLAFPAAPLHDPDCAGLCPLCGADLNAGDCGHRPEPVDPRWAALAELAVDAPSTATPPLHPTQEDDDARP
jgi:uncharacterized protein